MMIKMLKKTLEDIEENIVCLNILIVIDLNFF